MGPSAYVALIVVLVGALIGAVERLIDFVTAGS